MSDYTPDKWMIVKITNSKNESHYRVFACWYGGYLGSDSWKLNSGITKVTEDEKYYYFEGSSGSTYICNKDTYGASSYGYGVLSNMIEKSVAEGILMAVLPDDVNPMELNYEA
jgi:hypothetical protein